MRIMPTVISQKIMNDQCPVCGGEMIGDGYTVVVHCENVHNPMGIEPDAEPIYCELNQET